MNYFFTVTLPDWIREHIIFLFKDEYSHQPTPLAKLLLVVIGIGLLVGGVSELYLYRNNFDRMVVVDVYSRSETFVLDAAEEACNIRPKPGAGTVSRSTGEEFMWDLPIIDGENHIFTQNHTLNVPIEGSKELVTLVAGEEVYMQSDIPEGEIRDAVYSRALSEYNELNFITVINPIPDQSKLVSPVKVRCVRHATIDWTIWN